MTRVLGTLLALVLALTLGGSATAAPTASASGPAPSVAPDARKRDVPTREQWIADVRAVMAGSHADVRARIAAAEPGEKLGVNFDIDNTVIATYYDGGGAIPKMLRFTRFLQRKGVAVFFNTGRDASQRKRTLAQLKRTGFPVTGLCLRPQGKTLPYGKQRCRDSFIAQGYTLIANVGNNDTDFVGDGYEKAYVLPNYDGVLG